MILKRENSNEHLPVRYLFNHCHLPFRVICPSYLENTLQNMIEVQHNLTRVSWWFFVPMAKGNDVQCERKSVLGGKTTWFLLAMLRSFLRWGQNCHTLGPLWHPPPPNWPEQNWSGLCNCHTKTVRSLPHSPFSCVSICQFSYQIFPLIESSFASQSTSSTEHFIYNLILTNKCVSIACIYEYGSSLQLLDVRQHKLKTETTEADRTWGVELVQLETFCEYLSLD